MRLRRVLEHEEAVAGRDRADVVHRRGPAVEMHRDDHPRARGDRRLEPVRVEIERPRVRVDGHGRRAGPPGGQPGGDEGIAGDDHLVAGRDPARLDHEPERVESAPDRDAVTGVDEVGEILLEGGQFGAEQVPAASDHPLDGSVDRGCELVVRRSDVEERDARGGYRLRQFRNSW